MAYFGTPTREQAYGRKLTLREVEVFDLVITGLTNKEIATKLFVEEKTIKFHMTNILKKRGAKTRYELTFQEAQRKTKEDYVPRLSTGSAT